MSYSCSRGRSSGVTPGSPERANPGSDEPGLGSRASGAKMMVPASDIEQLKLGSGDHPDILQWHYCGPTVQYHVLVNGDSPPHLSRQTELKNIQVRVRNVVTGQP